MNYSTLVANAIPGLPSLYAAVVILTSTAIVSLLLFVGWSGLWAVPVAVVQQWESQRATVAPTRSQGIAEGLE